MIGLKLLVMLYIENTLHYIALFLNSENCETCLNIVVSYFYDNCPILIHSLLIFRGLIIREKLRNMK